MKGDEGANPKKVGSLLGDKPISSFFETLRYKVRVFLRRGSSPSAKEEEGVKASSETKRENTLEGMKPRRVTAAA